MLGVWVRSLGGELRSHTPHGQRAKKWSTLKKKKIALENKRNEVSQVPKAIGNRGCVKTGQALFGLKSQILFDLMMVLLSEKKLYNLVECK